MEGILLSVLVVVVGPVVVFFWMRIKVNGKILCWILGEDRSAKSKLCKVAGDYVLIGGDKYLIDSDTVRLVRYPTGWPVWLQQTVPVCLYNEGNADPIDWITQQPKGRSAKELAAILDPEWLKAIVRGTKESSSQAIPNGFKTMLMVAAGAAVVGLVVMFYLLSKIAALETVIKAGSGS